MKKFIKCFMIICLAFVVSFAFYGCEDDSNFYQTTSDDFENFITTICKNEEYNSGIKYGENISTIINKIRTEPNYVSQENQDKLNSYTQIPDVYDKIFVNTFKFISEFSGILVNKPTDVSGKVKGQYKDLSNKLKKATINIQNFAHKVLEIDKQFNKTGFPADEMVKDIYLQVVKEYKRDYIDITNQVIDICDSFSNICENYIFPKHTSYIQNGEYIELSKTQITNEKTLAVLKSSISTLKSSIEYLNGFNGEYKLLENDQFVETLEKYNNIDLSIDTEVTVQQLQQWLNNYTAFLGEKENFEKSITSVDFDKLVRIYNFDYDTYLNDFPTQKPFVDNIKEFSSSSITNLYNSISSMC